MSLNLIKLCVGIESPDHLARVQAARLGRAAGRGRAPADLSHRTRMMPRRKAELLDGGSIYWVIKGAVRLRQRILDLRPVVDAEGISRCDIVLDPELIATRPQARRAFQGWRYLDAKDAPEDAGPLRFGRDGRALNDDAGALAAELAELGLV